MYSLDTDQSAPPLRDLDQPTLTIIYLGRGVDVSVIVPLPAPRAVPIFTVRFTTRSPV